MKEGIERPPVKENELLEKKQFLHRLHTILEHERMYQYIDIILLSTTFFHTHGLLKQFVQFYQSNPQRVLEDILAYSTDCHSSTPVESIPTIPVDFSPLIESSSPEYTWFVQRRAEYEDDPRIHEKSSQLHEKISDFRYDGKGGKRGPKRRNKNEQRKERTRSRFDSQLKWENKKYERELWQDLRTVITNSVFEGQNSALLPGNETPYVSLMLAAHKGHQGNLYIPSFPPADYDHLTQMWTELVLDDVRLKGIDMSAKGMEKHRHMLQQDGRGYIPYWCLNELGGYVARRLKDRRWYDQTYEDSVLTPTLLYTWGIIPQKDSPDRFFQHTPRVSLDHIVSYGHFSQLSNESIAPLIAASDAAIKEGGYLIFNEDAETFALLEYACTSLFAQKYQPVVLPELHFKNHWMIWQKTNDSFDPSHRFILPESSFVSGHRATTLSDSEKSRASINDEAINDVPEFIIFDANSSIKDSQSFTLDDLAVELKISLMEVKRYLRKLGYSLSRDKHGQRVGKVDKTKQYTSADLAVLKDLVSKIK
ncbi:MAG: hypothetical protein ABI758_00395 [Candidatus Woesebacteria bacterium]